MIIVTQCCCGCTVRTGSLIIGILFGVLSIIDFIYEMILLRSPAEVKEDHGKAAETDDYSFMSKGEVVFAAIVNIIIIAACMSLIYGILKDRLNFIFVWIVTYFVYLVIVVLYILQIAITVMIHTEHVDQLWEIPVLFVVLAISMYSIVVVNSHYRNLKDGVTLPPRPPLIIAV